MVCKNLANGAFISVFLLVIDIGFWLLLKMKDLILAYTERSVLLDLHSGKESSLWRI